VTLEEPEISVPDPVQVDGGTHPEAAHPAWWRSAVVYQIYPRSFADSNGDGIGDLRGIVNRLDYIASLGVDAIWLSPVVVSPQADHGYDVADYRDIDPMFGDLQVMDELIAGAHARGIRVTMDFVPNHTSVEHAWFKAAVAAGPGSAERQRYHFRPGRGDNGEQPPNNWRSVFGGPSWTRITEPDGNPGEWYYHLFAPEQPDLNWHHPDVLPEFSDVLRFWLDRGVDGFRIDVSDALMKDDSFADTDDGRPIIPKDEASGVHEVYRAFRRVLDSYPGQRMAVIETGTDAETVALFLRPDEMQLAFNFAFSRCDWNATDIYNAITDAMSANALVGAPTTWVTDNHDTPRSVTRFASTVRLAGAYVPGLEAGDQSAPLDLALGTARHRAMALLMLALPGTVYLYNGQELGLPNVDDLPDEVLQDPVWIRSGHTERGRDGCRVPMPWTSDAPLFGFTDGSPWLPMPSHWDELAVAKQNIDPSSMLSMYRRALALRRQNIELGTGELIWLDDAPVGTIGLVMAPPRRQGEVVAMRASAGDELDGIVVLVNPNDVPMSIPPSVASGVVMLASDSDIATGDRIDQVPANCTVWLRLHRIG
jgi:alpha-glucosidase